MERIQIYFDPFVAHMRKIQPESWNWQSKSAKVLTVKHYTNVIITAYNTALFGRLTNILISFFFSVWESKTHLSETQENKMGKKEQTKINTEMAYVMNAPQWHPQTKHSSKDEQKH